VRSSALRRDLPDRAAAARTLTDAALASGAIEIATRVEGDTSDGIASIATVGEIVQIGIAPASIVVGEFESRSETECAALVGSAVEIAGRIQR